MRTIRPGVAGLVGIVLLSGCATAGGSRGTAGGVAWEVTDIGQVVSRDNQRVLWSYAVVLRETAGRTVRFEQVVHSMWTPGEMTGGNPVTAPFDRRLQAGGELRVHFTDNWGWMGGRSTKEFGGAAVLPTVRVERRLVGQDGAGQSVVVPVRVDLNRSVGRVSRPTPVSSPPPPERILGPFDVPSLAGLWRGAYRPGQGGFGIPLELVIREDGSVQGGEYDPVVNRFSGTARVAEGRLDLSLGRDRGTLTLHEGGGRRVLVGDMAGTRSSSGGGTRIIRYPVRLDSAPAIR